MYGLNDTRSRLQICKRETLRINFCERCFNELHLESAIFVFHVTNYMDVNVRERKFALLMFLNICAMNYA